MPISTINNIKKNILQAAYNAGEGHLGSAFSIVDILYVLYRRLFNSCLVANLINIRSKLFEY